jgi:CspA family cold shock protein
LWRIEGKQMAGRSLAPRSGRAHTVALAQVGIRARSRTEEEKVPQGTVKWFSTQKGYGFITQDEGGDIFVHVTGLAPGTTGLEENQRVEFELSEGRKGPQATDVKPASAAAPAPAAAAEPEPEAEPEAEDEASSDEEV